MVVLAVGFFAAFAVLVGTLWSSRPTAAGPAELRYPGEIAIDSSGAALIVDRDRHQVLRLVPGRPAEVVIGTGEPGSSGDGRAAIDATLDYPSAVAVAADGTMFVASGGAVRSVDRAGIIRTVDALGSGLSIHGLAVVGEDLYVAQESTLTVLSDVGTTRKVVIDGANPFGFIEDIAAHPDGGIAVSDSEENRVFHLTEDGIVSVLIGADSDTPGDGRATETSISQPTGITFDQIGRLLVSEAGLNRVRRMALLHCSVVRRISGLRRSRVRLRWWR